MNMISQFLNWIFEPSPRYDQQWTHAYLADAVDLNDLERRMRQLDRQRDIGPFGFNG
jgi:hypothetical protein